MIISPMLLNARDRSIPDTRIDAIVREFKKYDGVISMSVGPFMLSLGRTAIGIAGKVSAEDSVEMEMIRELSRSIRKVSIVVCEDCEQRIKDRLVRRVNRALSDCEPLLDVRGVGLVVRIHGDLSANGKNIKNLLLFVVDRSEPIMIRVKGNINVQEILDFALQYA